MRHRQQDGEQSDGAARRPSGASAPAASRAPWIATTRVAGIVAVGALAVTWLNLAPGARQIAADRGAAAPQVPVAEPETIAGRSRGGRGAPARATPRRAAPRREREEPLPHAGGGERAALLPKASAGPRSAARAGARAAADLGLALIGIATTETAEGPQRTAVLLRRGEVMLAAAGQAVGGGWTLETVEDDGVVFHNAAGGRQRRTLP